MSQPVITRRVTATDIKARKGGEPIVALTAYHAHTARIADTVCDFCSLATRSAWWMHGLDSTVPVTMEMMILQGRR